MVEIHVERAATDEKDLVLIIMPVPCGRASVLYPFNERIVRLPDDPLRPVFVKNGQFLSNI